MAGILPLLKIFTNENKKAFPKKWRLLQELSKPKKPWEKLYFYNSGVQRMYSSAYIENILWSNFPKVLKFYF